MDKGCHRCSAHPKALLAEWMRSDIAVTDFLPRTAIPLMPIVATGEVLVVPLHKATMFLAIACPAVGQIGTASIAAGAFRFHWHRLHILLGIRKALEGIAPSKAHVSYFSMIHNSTSRLGRQKSNEGQCVSTRVKPYQFSRFFKIFLWSRLTVLTLHPITAATSDQRLQRT